MRTESYEVFLDVAASDAFDFLVDYRNDSLWRDELLSAELTEGEPGCPGCTYAGLLQWYGVDVPHELKLIEARRPEYIRIASLSPNLEVDVRYALEDVDDRCRLNARYALDVTGPLAVVEPFAWAIFNGWCRDDLPRLREHFSKNRVA